jgi:hypothetical protein
MVYSFEWLIPDLYASLGQKCTRIVAVRIYCQF